MAKKEEKVPETLEQMHTRLHGRLAELISEEDKTSRAIEILEELARIQFKSVK